MVKKVILLSAVLLLVMPFVFAVSTEIKVKTLADHKVSIFVLKPNEIYNLLESFHKTSDGRGEVSVVYNSENIDKFDVRVNVKNKNQIVFSERFEDYDAGVPIFIRMDYQEINGRYSPITEKNETKEEVNKTEDVEIKTEIESNEVVEEDSNTGVITGAVVKDDESKFPSIFYYIIGIVAGLVIVFFIVRRFVSTSTGFAVAHVSGRQSVKGDGSSSNEVNLREYKRLQRELENARREILRLKKQDQIKEIERKIEEEKEELYKLKKGMD